MNCTVRTLWLECYFLEIYKTLLNCRKVTNILSITAECGITLTLVVKRHNHAAMALWVGRLVLFPKLITVSLLLSSLTVCYP